MQLGELFQRGDRVRRPPFILSPEGRPQLMKHMIAGMALCRGCGLASHREKHRGGLPALMLPHEMYESRRALMANRIAGLWKRKRALRRLRQMLHGVYKKQFDPESQQM